MYSTRIQSVWHHHRKLALDFSLQVLRLPPAVRLLVNLGRLGIHLLLKTKDELKDRPV